MPVALTSSAVAAPILFTSLGSLVDARKLNEKKKDEFLDLRKIKKLFFSKNIRIMVAFISIIPLVKSSLLNKKFLIYVLPIMRKLLAW